MRKGTSMKIMKRLLQKATSVRFAPEDTAGQRQGLVLAMEGREDSEEEVAETLQRADALSVDALSIEDLSSIEIDTRVDARDRHIMTVAASEFSGFIGSRNVAMLEFLQQMYDGEEIYRYKISQQGRGKEIVLQDAMLNIIGCTQPGSLVEALPKSAGNKGFLSRIIFVYGDKKYRSVPRPTEPPPEIVEEIKARYAEIQYEFSGEMTETKDAYDYCVSLYEAPTIITDSRFIYYNERRYTHFIKLAMCLAAAAGRMQIEQSDYEEADAILKTTESGMPDALGEFGMSPIAAAKQTILEFLRAAKEPMPVPVLRAVMHRDLKMQDLVNCLNDLEAAGQIIKEHSTTLGLVYMPKAKSSQETDDIIAMLGEGQDDEDSDESSGGIPPDSGTIH